MKNIDNVAQTGFIIFSIIVSLIFKSTSSVIETDLNISSDDDNFEDECVTSRQCSVGYYCQRSSHTCKEGSRYGQPCNLTEECLDARTWCSEKNQKCDCTVDYKYFYGECKSYQYCLNDKDCTDNQRCRDRKCYDPKTEKESSFPLSNIYVAAMIAIGCIMFILSCCVGIMIYVRRRRGEPDELEESIIPNSSSRTQINPFTFDNEPDFSQFTPSPEYDPPPPYDPTFMRTPLSLPPFSVSLPPYSEVAPGSSTETTTTENATLAPQTVTVVSTDQNNQAPQNVGSITSTLLTTIN